MRRRLGTNGHPQVLSATSIVGSKVINPTGEQLGNLKELMIDPQDQRVGLDVDKEVLKDAPGFNKDHWSDNAQYEAGLLLAIYEYYGYSPYWMPDK